MKIFYEPVSEIQFTCDLMDELGYQDNDLDTYDHIRNSVTIFWNGKKTVQSLETELCEIAKTEDDIEVVKTELRLYLEVHRKSFRRYVKENGLSALRRMDEKYKTNYRTRLDIISVALNL